MMHVEYSVVDMTGIVIVVLLVTIVLQGCCNEEMYEVSRCVILCC